MWTKIKSNKKKIIFLKKNFAKNLGEDFIIYNLKILVKKYKKIRKLKISLIYWAFAQYVT